MQANLQTQSESLTRRQVQLVRAIACFQASQCCSPTIGELACELGISRSTTFGHIEELRRKGLLVSSTGRARSLKLASKAHDLLGRDGQDITGRQVDTIQGIPLAGRVAAGMPIEAIEDTEKLSLGGCFGNTDDVFALEVRGDSMIDDDIRDGDYVICRRSVAANEGQLVIAIVDEENATVKRFHKDKGLVRLEAANEDYSPIYSDNCRIETVVVGLVRKL